jgi:16S rRNA (guanine966-N2)-methyltransferase
MISQWTQLLPKRVSSQKTFRWYELRIIAGKHKGRRIHPPHGLISRPTTDKAREAVFSSIQNIIAASHVLDLYAGSGAMGIEAISRGADSATFVDLSPHAVKAIKDNISSLNIQHKTEVLQLDCTRLPSKALKKYDIVFMDPPYGKNLVPRTIDALTDGGFLAQGALIIAEHEGDLDTEGLEVVKQKRYGKSYFTFIKAV